MPVAAVLAHAAGWAGRQVAAAPGSVRVAQAPLWPGAAASAVPGAHVAHADAGQGESASIGVRRLV